MPPLVMRPYQSHGIDSACEALRARVNTMYVAPTGTGKTYCQINIHKRLKMMGVILTPSLTIIRGLLEKLGVSDTSESAAEGYGIFTPVRFRNRLIAGRVRKPKYLVVDECHHDAADTYRQVYQLVECPRVGFTATNYRGTPQQTAAFLEQWDRVVTLLTWEQAVSEGYITLPEFHTVPLVDDDLIEIRGGELFITSLDSATKGKFVHLRESLASFNFFAQKRPAVITMPGVSSAKDFYSYAFDKGHAVGLITADTTEQMRGLLLSDMVARKLALLQVRTLGEGVDYPIRLLADVAPTLSPVKWVQLFGRVCRPVRRGERPGVYVAFNRNIQHHGYCIRDILPPNVVRESQEAFGGQSLRAVYRMAGIEGFGRIKPAEVKTSGGEYVHLYVMQATDDDGRFRLACLLCPAEAEPYWFRKELPDGKWKQVAKPSQLSATQSISNYAVTPAQLGWWERKAAWWGIERDQPLDARTFQLLPILSDTHLRLR